MNIDKNRINTEITHNEILLNMYRTDPLFKKTIDTINDHDMQESELLNIFFQLCSTIKVYIDMCENYHKNSTIVMPFTKEEKDALRFFNNWNGH